MAATTEQIQLHKLLSQLFLLSSIPTYFVTRYLIVAPFGRHAPKRGSGKHNEERSTNRWWYGPTFDARLSWCLFESPNLIWSWYCLFHWCDPDVFFLESKGATISAENGRLRLSANAILLSLFALHYVNRAIVYPLLMSASSNGVPLIVSAFAWLVTSWNGYLQCYYLVQVERLAPLSLSASLENVQTWAGVFLFFLGMGINVHSDGVLRNLRRRGPAGTYDEKQRRHEETATREHAYYVPRSLLFTYVSCPNQAGEILEWFGYAMASGFSLPLVAFFVYTTSNLVPRAVAHHEWYLRKFDDYPVERQWAVVPFIV